MNRLLYFIVSLLLLVSCQKDLDIDYHTVAPFYVVQAELTDSVAQVLITSSRPMNDSVQGKGLDVAESIVLTDETTEQSEQFVFGPDGYYRGANQLKGETGHTYRMEVTIDGKTHVAHSTMRPTISLDSIRFQWLSTSGMKMLVLKYYHTFPQDSLLSYSHCRMTRNGQFYRSHTRKQSNPLYLQAAAMLGCTTEKKMEKDDPDDREAVLYENDQIRVELWTIDRPAFDFFFSLHAGQSNASNPISNFSGGIGGYFSAHHVCAIDTTFHFSDIHED